MSPTDTYRAHTHTHTRHVHTVYTQCVYGTTVDHMQHTVVPASWLHSMQLGHAVVHEGLVDLYQLTDIIHNKTFLLKLH